MTNDETMVLSQLIGKLSVSKGERSEMYEMEGTTIEFA